MPDPTVFADNATLAIRIGEVPAASFISGGSLAGCCPGIGINMAGGAVVGTPEQFTLNDQDEAPRTPQVSAYIGNTGLGAGTEGKGTVAISTGPVGPNGGGGIGATTSATLVSLAAGWTGV
jgi:hypothetical protein